MLTLALSELKTGDWLVLVAYFGLLVGAGLWSSLGKVKDTNDYFLAARSMPVWAVMLSILSTAQSAATYVGVPQVSYAGDLRYLSSNIGGFIAAIILALFIIPRYYRAGVATPYELLEKRFGRSGRVATAWAYLVGRVFASGARVFIAAIPTALILFGDKHTPGDQAVIIVGFTILGIALCFFGGVRSVIWVDVLQVFVYLGACIATILVLLNRIPADVGDIAKTLSEQAPSKLTVLSTSTSPSVEFSIWTAMTGFVLLAIASHGMDQDLVQRMLTCRSAAKGSWAVMSGILVGIPAVLIFLTLGLLLWVFYQSPALMQGAPGPSATPSGSDKVFQFFALKEMSGGLAGLVIAGLFACGPAGINSGLNAMASTFVNDIYKTSRPGRADTHYLRIGRFATIGAGVALGLMALACIAWYDPKGSTILDFVLSIMNFAYAGLLGVFFTAMFTKRGSARSVIWALIGGFLGVLFFQKPLWVWVLQGWDLFMRGKTDVTPAMAVEQFPWLAASYPWHLVLGAGVAFLLCIADKPKAAVTPPPQ